MSNIFPNDFRQINIDVTVPKKKLTRLEKNQKIIRFFSKANIVIFASVFAVISVYLIAGKRPTVSETENRTLTPWPSFSVKALMNGSYTDNIEAYYNDTVPGRTKFKNLAASIKSYSGKELDGIKVHTINKSDSSSKKQEAAVTSVTSASAQPDIQKNPPAVTTGISDTPVQTTVTTPAPIPEDDPADAGELSNNIMIYKNRGIPIYYGSLESGTEYAGILNSYKKDLGSAVNVYSMVCPTAISFYWPSSSSISHGSESENIDNINASLKDITPVNIIDTLMQHRSEHIYSRTDHHWQARGAYYAAQQFAKQANVPFDDLSKYEEVTVPGYVGTLYGYSGDAALNDNPEDFVFYRPDNKYTTHYYTPSFEYQNDGALLVEAYGSSLYCTFMGGDEKIVHIETDAPNDRTLFIIKDSYGNALVPFLTNSFKNIFVVDMRYFDLNIISFMKEHNATDLLFAMNTFSATGSNYLALETIRTQ